MKKEVNVSVLSATGVAHTRAVPEEPLEITEASETTVKRPLMAFGVEGSLSVREMAETLLLPLSFTRTIPQRLRKARDCSSASEYIGNSFTPPATYSCSVGRLK